MNGDDDKDRSIRVSDKLNYRAIIQDKINRYLEAIGTKFLDKAVRALRNSVYFDIPGLPFKTEILKKEKELNDKRRFKIKWIAKHDCDELIHPYKLKINKSIINGGYDMELAEFLIELVAVHDGLMGVKGMVEEGGDMEEINEDEENE